METLAEVILENGINEPNFRYTGARWIYITSIATSDILEQGEYNKTSIGTSDILEQGE